MTMDVSCIDVRFKTPANFYVCGPSQSGKSHLIRSMLLNLSNLFTTVPTRILYLAGEKQKEFEQLTETIPNISVVIGFPDNIYDMLEGYDNSMVILDDLMTECSNDQRVSNLFTRGSHHRNISIFYITQNLFPPGKLSRTISLNSHYMFVFKNLRDSLGISTLAKQMFPRSVSYLLDSFKDATENPYGYLLIDCHPLTPPEMRLRTNILPGEKQIVYLKRT